jgi:phosphate transport system permease protein
VNGSLVHTMPARRKAKDIAARTFLILAVLVALAPLLWILVEVVRQGAGAITGLSFFTEPPPGSPLIRGGGVANGIIGTLTMVGMALIGTIPLAILGAVWLSEFDRGSVFGRAVRFFGDVMTGIPSIVFGVFVYSLIVLATRSFSAIAGSVAIGLIMWPVMLRASEEVLRLVPSEIREASYALGVPRWRTVLKVVLPTASSGLVTALMLGTARAAGETAPLLFTALGNQFISFRVTKPMSALPLEIFRGATTAFSASVERAWAAALTLVVLILVLTTVARILTARRAEGGRG